MTNEEKRKIVVNAIISREGKNTYTQTEKRTLCGFGYSDCSSLQQWAYQKANIEIGSYTGAQIDKGIWVSRGGAYPKEEVLQYGDELFFATNYDNGRPYKVGHIEMYVGNGQISGHGSGIGPTRKNMKAYCEQRNRAGKPYIGVKRYIVTQDTQIKEEPVLNNVKKGQKWLNIYYNRVIKLIIGENLEEDGIYGVKTRKVVLAVWKDLMNRKFGARLTLKNENFGAMCKEYSNRALVQKGSNGTYTFLVEIILSSKKYYTGDMDAVCGKYLTTSIKEFQHTENLVVDGICGENTWYRLFNT